MRNVLLALVVVPLLVLSVLSLRPGGLRRQLRNIVRRLKLALVLLGVYMVATGFVRLAFPGSWISDAAIGVMAVGLVVTFLILGQDRQYLQR